MAAMYYPAGAKVQLAVGSTALIWRHPTRAGVIIKSQWKESPETAHNHKFRTEVAILNVLGKYPRITEFLGLIEPLEPARGLLFTEAINGSVQEYLVSHSNMINNDLRLKWCKQAAEALAYCHGMGVLHCDLRPDNMLLNAHLDLLLCDFGGSKNEEYDGGGVPDFGFSDPRDETCDPSEAAEVFGLGSSYYTITVGHLPHGPSKIKSNQEYFDYMEEFSSHLHKGKFPDTSDIKGGEIIIDCWMKNIKCAEEAHKRYLELEAGMRSYAEDRSSQPEVSCRLPTTLEH